MKRPILFSILFLSISYFSYSQDKKLDKIKSYYNQKNYEKCISKSVKYYVEKPSVAAAYYYYAMSYYKLYEDQADIKSIKEISRKLYKGKSKKGAEKYEEIFKTEINDFHSILKKYAQTYYQANKPKSRFYYDYLAKIYSDTLEQYNELVLNKAVRPDAEIIKLTKEGKINQVDKNGLKQGKWMKVYSNGITAYIANFKDNKPVGELKRFHENGKISSLLNYDKQGKFANATFYNDKGKKISEGKYIGKVKEGKWLYYKDKILIREENYSNGVLNGTQTVFFNNKQISDRKKYIKGKQVGVWEKYYNNGKPKLKAFLKNGLMDGSMIRYYRSGATEVKGQYKNDLKEGVWTFYSEDGKSSSVKTFKNGVDINKKDVEEKESESYKKGIENGKKLKDPKDYKNNPEGYINK